MALISNIIEDARRILSDTVEPYRYSQADLVDALNHAFASAFALRPDLFLSLNFVVPSYTETSIEDEHFPLNPAVEPAFPQYIAAYIEQSDDEFVLDGRTKDLFNAFNARMRGVA